MVVSHSRLPHHFGEKFDIVMPDAKQLLYSQNSFREAVILEKTVEILNKEKKNIDFGPPSLSLSIQSDTS